MNPIVGFFDVTCSRLCVRRQETRASVLALLFLPLILAGCGGNLPKTFTVSGTVTSGTRPIVNASVQVYATGTAGDGSAATPLLTIPANTDTAGNFELTGVHSCPSSSSELYIVAAGGAPADLGVKNSSAALMTLLGLCSTQADASGIRLNEVTTIASVYAIAPFMKGPTAIGSSASDAQALANAAKFASQVANLRTGSSPGSAGETAPTGKLNALANLLNSCVDSTGGSAGDGSLCGNLYQYAGGASASPLKDTVAAVLAIATAPTVNVGSLYQLTLEKNAFAPALNAAPPDWTLQIVQTPPPPAFSPSPGSYTSAQSVTLSDADASAAIFYTADGTTPTSASTRYSGSISVGSTTTIRAVAVNAGLSSEVSSGDFTFTPPSPPIFSPAPGTYSSAQSVTLSNNSPSATVYYTTDGSTPSAASIRYTGAISLSASATIRSIAIVGTLSSAAAIGIYNIIPPSTTGATGTPAVPPAQIAQKLAFVSAPSASAVGAAIAPAITVIAEDASGNPVTSGSIPVTLAIGNNPGGAVLQGTISANAGATPATFTGLAVSQPGTGYTLIASSPGLASVTSQSFSVAVVSGRQANATYYVSNSGSDANPGTTASAPWKTIAQVNNSKLAPGTQVVFDSSGVWHEQLTAQSGVTYGPYGPAQNCTLNSALVASCINIPVIDGADAITGWSSTGNATFQAAYSGSVSKAFVDSLYTPATPLQLLSSAAAVNTTPGSIYGDGKKVYVHLADGSNPDSHTIEVSGTRSYGVLVGGPSNVTVTGLEIIRTAKSGYLNYAFAGTGASNQIENSVFFNNGDSLPDQNLGGPIEGAILSVGGYSQIPVAGFSAVNNWVGQMDFPHDKLNYSWAGIQLDGMASAQVMKNKVATVNGWAIRVQDFFNNSCTAPVISYNETVNSEGNISVAGCLEAVVSYNSAHNSFGNGLEAGPGLRLSDLSTGLYVGYNDFEHLRSAYKHELYNGIDINYVANGTAIGNRCFDVAFTCMTLEADSGPSSGWKLTGNTFDASQNVYANDFAPNSILRVYPFYIRDTSLAGGLTMSQNTLVVNSASPYIKYGASAATDQTHDLTQPQFDTACPGCEISNQ